MAGRSLIILVLVSLGFVILFVREHDPTILAIACWVVAGVYAYLTKPTRRGLL